MPRSAKIFLAIVIATLLGGSGYFYLKSAKKPVSLPVNKASEVQDIDTSDWQTYRSEELGFEIKVPKELGADDARIGPQPSLENEFWRDQVGSVRFLNAKTGMQFEIRIKDSELSLEKFSKNLIVSAGNNIFINNLHGKEYILDRREGVVKNYQQWLLLNQDRKYYYFNFTSHSENIDKNVIIWKKIISTFKPLK